MDIIGSSARRLDDTDEPVREIGRNSLKFDVTRAHYHELALRWDRVDRIMWCRMRPSGRPCFTTRLLDEMGVVYAGVSRMFDDRAPRETAPFDYFIFDSTMPGVYSLGGDLAYFVELVRAGDFEAMRHYAHLCVARQDENSRAFGAPVVTISLVRGDALGGGFEHALSHDIIVAERSAKLGLPEVLFNLFPGMGAYSFISRRLDRRAAEKLILSGRIHTGEELHELGIVDVLAEDGEGEATLRDYLREHDRKLNMRRAVYEARRRVNPVSLDELLTVTDLWAKTAMDLDERDLKVMARLVAAQDRRVAAIRTPVREV